MLWLQRTINSCKVRSKIEVFSQARLSSEFFDSRAFFLPSPQSSSKHVIVHVFYCALGYDRENGGRERIWWKGW